MLDREIRFTEFARNPANLLPSTTPLNDEQHDDEEGYEYPTDAATCREAHILGLTLAVDPEREGERLYALVVVRILETEITLELHARRFGLQYVDGKFRSLEVIALEVPDVRLGCGEHRS